MTRVRLTTGARLRDLSWPQDRAALLALDTSFTTDRVYRLEQTSRSCTLAEVAVSPPLYKCYSLAGEVESLASLDWVQVASDGQSVVGVVAMQLQSWNRRANLCHLYVDRIARHRGIGRALVEAAVEEARKRGGHRLWVETQTINYGAICFYERLGFEWCGLDTSLYDPDATQVGELAAFFSRVVT